MLYSVYGLESKKTKVELILQETDLVHVSNVSFYIIIVARIFGHGEIASTISLFRPYFVIISLIFL